MRNALWLDSLNITEDDPRPRHDGRMRWSCEPANVVDHCIKCGVPADRLYKHGAGPKKFADLPAHGHHVHICVWVQRYRCRECGGTFDHPLPEMDESRKMTKRCLAYVCEHGKRRTFADIAREIGVDEKTIRNVCKEGFIEALEKRDYGSPKILGIDELKLAGTVRPLRHGHARQDAPRSYGERRLDRRCVRQLPLRFPQDAPAVHSDGDCMKWLRFLQSRPVRPFFLTHCNRT